MQTAAGLAAAHRQGLVHLDVKPANILLENGIERVKLTDFGLARAVDDISMTRTGQITGTPQYMSPEQAQGQRVDHRTDLFSLGCVLYAMCTGRAVFRADSSVAVMHCVVHDEPRPIREGNEDILGWLCEIVDKLLAKKADDRFASAEDVEDLLSRHLAHLQQPTNVCQPERPGSAVNASSLASPQSERRMVRQQPPSHLTVSSLRRLKNSSPSPRGVVRFGNSRRPIQRGSLSRGWGRTRPVRTLRNGKRSQSAATEFVEEIPSRLIFL